MISVDAGRLLVSELGSGMHVQSSRQAKEGDVLFGHWTNMQATSVLSGPWMDMQSNSCASDPTPLRDRPDLESCLRTVQTPKEAQFNGERKHRDTVPLLDRR